MSVASYAPKDRHFSESIYFRTRFLLTMGVIAPLCQFLKKKHCGQWKSTYQNHS